MLPDLPPLTALRAFQAAGELLSFQEAARQLHVTPSAVSHQIRSLEDWMGTPLFIRGARQIRLTPAGRDLLHACNRSFLTLSQASQRLRKTRSQKLKISALPLITTSWLIPRLDRFEALHPGIALSIDTTNTIVDLERGDCDVAIRNVRAPTPGLVSRKLLDTGGVPVCTRKIANRLHVPADLAGETLIHISARPDAWPDWLARAGVEGLKPKRNLSLDTVPAALDAAARGHGVALGMHPLMWESPSATSLVAPFKLRPTNTSSYYVVHRRADGSRSDVKAFVNWITKEMAAWRDEARRKGRSVA